MRFQALVVLLVALLLIVIRIQATHAVVILPTSLTQRIAQRKSHITPCRVTNCDIHTSILNPASHNLDIIVRIIIHNPCHRRLLHRLLLFLAKPIFGLKFLLHLYNKLGLI